MMRRRMVNANPHSKSEHGSSGEYVLNIKALWKSLIRKANTASYKTPNPSA